MTLSDIFHNKVRLTVTQLPPGMSVENSSKENIKSEEQGIQVFCLRPVQRRLNLAVHVPVLTLS